MLAPTCTKEICKRRAKIYAKMKKNALAVADRAKSKKLGFVDPDATVATKAKETKTAQD